MKPFQLSYTGGRFKQNFVKISSYHSPGLSGFSSSPGATFYKSKRASPVSHTKCLPKELEISNE